MSENLTPNSEQETEQEQEQPDAIQLLAERLGAIESALGIGSSQPSESNLLGRLSAIETNLSKDQRERNLPKTITHAQLRSAQWMRKHGVQLEDIGTKIQVVPD
jgi:hypothetical protein